MGIVPPLLHACCKSIVDRSSRQAPVGCAKFPGQQEVLSNQSHCERCLLEADKSRIFADIMLPEARLSDTDAMKKLS